MNQQVLANAESLAKFYGVPTKTKNLIKHVVFKVFKGNEVEYTTVLCTAIYKYQNTGKWYTKKDEVIALLKKCSW